MVEKNSEEIGAAIQKDLGRDPVQEVANAVRHVQELISHVEEWSAPKIVAKPQMFNNDSDEVMLMTEPLGVALVISPWNFPLVTSMPVALAIAGGNTVILKLSELSPTFSSVFARLVAKHFDEKLFAAVEGAVPEVTALLAERFDHITYTGNPTVAKVIMTAAAKYLTPVLLELGGKK
ncbi:hypothetical protein OSTOST_25660 [Ostertagia ostertagi]